MGSKKLTQIAAVRLRADYCEDWNLACKTGAQRACRFLTIDEGTFEWALIQMKAGEKVTRVCWLKDSPSAHWCIDKNGEFRLWYLGRAHEVPCTFDNTEISATDWQMWHNLEGERTMENAETK